MVRRRVSSIACFASYVVEKLPSSHSWHFQSAEQQAAVFFLHIYYCVIWFTWTGISLCLCPCNSPACNTSKVQSECLLPQFVALVVRRYRHTAIDTGMGRKAHWCAVLSLNACVCFSLAHVCRFRL